MPRYEMEISYGAAVWPLAIDAETNRDAADEAERIADVDAPIGVDEYVISGQIVGDHGNLARVAAQPIERA